MCRSKDGSDVSVLCPVPLVDIREGKSPVYDHNGKPFWLLGNAFLMEFQVAAAPTDSVSFPVAQEGGPGAGVSGKGSQPPGGGSGNDSRGENYAEQGQCWLELGEGEEERP